MRRTSQSGFTLLEIIVTIIVAALAGAVLAVFMGTAVKQSSDPLHVARDEAGIERTMEWIISDYVKRINSNNSTSTAIEDLEEAINDDKKYGDSANAIFIKFQNGTEQNISSSHMLKVSVTGRYHSLKTLLGQARVTGEEPYVHY